eukprot:m.86780 g.86780  ORF g.86780 m.86780 type:complete len:75 (-) comp12814_c0_seq15:3320-3544(-)
MLSDRTHRITYDSWPCVACVRLHVRACVCVCLCLLAFTAISIPVEHDVPLEDAEEATPADQEDKWLETGVESTQ